MSGSKKTATCLDCGEVGTIFGRGLDSKCYHRHRNAGTLDKFPVQAFGGPRNGLPDLCRSLGISYRMLDYWTTQGYLPGGNPGSGKAREVTPDLRQRLRQMAALVTLGMSPAAAAEILDSPGMTWARAGITVTVSDAEATP